MYSMRFSCLCALVATWQTGGLASVFDLSFLQPRATGSLESYIAEESPIAVQGILNNLGPDGSKAAGAHSGILVASPSKYNPNYYYTWTRDSALTFKLLVEMLIEGNSTLESHIQDYIISQANVQTIVNPSGQLTNGSGLGEPKFYVNETAFEEPWGRPQRDGPALRATTMIAYANHLLDTSDDDSTVKDVLWPIIRNDLTYVGQYWNETGFDLWEEVEGSSFFTIAASHRALTEGANLASRIDETCAGCISQAPQALCFMQTFWNGTNIVANINDEAGRSGIDVNSILTSIHVFDPLADCDGTTFQPCSSKALANHKIVTDSFRDIYDINDGIDEGKAVAIGRYPEDIYYDGNPWYLATLAAAEQLYDALYQWNEIGSLTVDDINMDFFNDLVSPTRTGTYQKSSSTYEDLTSAVKTYADDYVSVVEKYTPSNGALAEQISKFNGTGVSAADLTWSYAAFLSAIARRNGTVPQSWGEPKANKVPSNCQSSSATGTYARATNTNFPSGGGSQSTGTGSGSSTTASTPCPTSGARTVELTFSLLVPTVIGEFIYVVGNVPQLGSWVPNEGVPLTARNYTGERPLWFSEIPVKVAAGVVVEWKGIKVMGDGRIEWQGGDNQVFRVPTACSATASASWTYRPNSHDLTTE